MMKRRAVAIVLAAFMLIGILFSYHFVIEESHHQCMGKHCPICAQIDDSIQFITSIKFVPILPFIMAVLFIFSKWVAHNTKHICVRNTLISLKVELLD